MRELEAKKQALEKALKEFRLKAQDGYSKDLTPKLASWQDVTDVVERFRERLERKQEATRWRRATKHLRSFCNSIQAHSSALQMLPAGNQYVSIFYGSLVTVIEVSMTNQLVCGLELQNKILSSIQSSERYTKITEFLPQALVDINDAVSAVEKLTWLFSTETMKVFAWRMYGQIFSFLTEMIKWYTKRSRQRLLTSFNEHLPEFFEDQLDEIKKTAQLISKEAEFRSHAGLQIALERVESVSGKLDIIVDQMHRENENKKMTDISHKEFESHSHASIQKSQECVESVNEKLDVLFKQIVRNDDRRQNPAYDGYDEFYQQMNSIRRKELQDTNVLESKLQAIWFDVKTQEAAQSMADILEEEAGRQPPGQYLIPRLKMATQTEVTAFGSQEDLATEEQSSATDLSPVDNNISRDGLLVRTAELETYFDREKVQPDYEPAGNVLADPLIIARMRDWALATEPQVLYITESKMSLDVSVASKLGARYAAMARELGIPVCSYFCSLRHEDPEEGRTRETIELSALVYCLLRQLVELLPAAVDTNLVDFGNLDGTLATFSHALALLDRLISATEHPLLVFVIDSLDVLDDIVCGSTKDWLKKFVGVLLRHVEENKEQKVKILFTGSGTSITLSELLEPQSHLLADSTGSPRLGRRRHSGDPFVL